MTAPRAHPRARRRAGRSLLVLLLVAALAVPVVQAANRLQVHIDGEVHRVLSFDATVAEALEAEGLVVAAGDRVLPAPDTPLEEVVTVTVLRAIEVDLVIDGTVRSQRGAFRTVQGLLDEAGVEVTDGQVLRPSPATVLAHGDRVTIRSPHTVRLVADGTDRAVETHAATVGELLTATGTELGDEDLVDPARDAGLADGDVVVVQRVGYEDVSEEVALPFDEERRPAGDLFTDQTRVVQEGEDGVRVDSYRLRQVDGETVERELVGEEVVREPVPRIVEYGTAERPVQTAVDDGSVWYALARCESGARWDYNGGSGYDGGLQFHPDTWARNKPAGYPAYAYQATPEQQIEVGKIVQARGGWGVWPHCSAELGLR